MWHWQSKGVRDAIPGLCSQEGRVELPGKSAQPVGGQDGRVTLTLKGWLTESLFQSSEVGTGRLPGSGAAGVRWVGVGRSQESSSFWKSEARDVYLSGWLKQAED